MIIIIFLHSLISNIVYRLCDVESCPIEPYTGAYTCTVGYLLMFAIVLEMCANADGDLRYHYSEMIK